MSKVRSVAVLSSMPPDLRGFTTADENSNTFCREASSMGLCDGDKGAVLVSSGCAGVVVVVVAMLGLVAVGELFLLLLLLLL